MGHILKSKQKNKCVCIHEIMQLIMIKVKMKMKEDHIDTIQIDPGPDMDTNIVNIRNVLV